MELRPLATDVYACLQEDRGLGYSNSGLINRAGGLVVDTFWDLPHTREMIQLYASVWRGPAERVVNTHHNGDHCWGNQLFAGAEIIGHRLCAEAMPKEDPGLLQTLSGLGGADDPALAHFARLLEGWDFRDIQITPPNRLMDERLDLDLDGLEVQLLYVGPAHTLGDVIVHLPESGIVYTGDILFRLCTPLAWEGSFERWTAALDAIEALEPELVVPGHGPLCGVEGPREMKAYLVYVASESKRFFESGVSALDAAKKMDLGPYADWTEPERLISHVERAYRELAGEPAETSVDAPTLLRGMYEVALHRGLLGRNEA